MATFKSTTFGKISGRYGEALATQSKSTGKNYLRVASVPSNPRTDKQVAHRAKFGFINSALRAFYPVYKVTFGGNPGIRYAINRAFKEAITGDYPNYAIDLSKLLFSEGAIYPTDTTSVVKLPDGRLQIDWDDTILAGSGPSDLVNLVFYNEITNQAMLLNSDSQRSAATIMVGLPDIWKGGTIHCWLYFTSANSTSRSTSQYINSVQV